MSNLNECTDRTTHFEIVNNPDIEEFLSNCSYMIEPTNEEAKQMAALFSTLPIYDEELQLPVNIISIDGSNYEASVNENMPFTRVGYVKIGNILIKRDSFNNLGHSKFVDPFEVAEIAKSNIATTFAFPSSNMQYKNQVSVRDGFRLALEKYLYKYRNCPDDYKTSLRTTLFKLASYRNENRKKNSADGIILHRCPNSGCNAENLLVLDIKEEQLCPSCHKPIYPSDCLRIWEEIEDYAPNQRALTRFTNVIEHLFAIHYIRTIVESNPQSFVETLSQLCFFMDGPLAIYGNAAWVHSSIMKYLAELNVTMEKYGKPKIMILGVIKNGNINDYFKLIENEITNNSIFCLTDVIRDKYINFNRNASATTFGNETYYGQDFIYKTPTGRLFVFNVPYPFDTKSDISFFKEEKSKLENYKNIDMYLKLINEFECDLYEGAVVPVALARKHTVISLKPGSQVLDLLTKSKL